MSLGVEKPLRFFNILLKLVESHALPWFSKKIPMIIPCLSVSHVNT
jgi:hypothetical protein